MASLTQMTGFFTKQRKHNKTFKISYFFVDMYYLSNHAQLNYHIKNSNSELDIISKLESQNAISKISIYCKHMIMFHFIIDNILNSKFPKKYNQSPSKDDIEILQEIIKQGSYKQRPNQQLLLNSDIEKKNDILTGI